MDQNTQTVGTNTATPQAPEVPAPSTTITASPQSAADRMLEYKAIPGLFDDSPRKPKAEDAPPAAAAPEPTGTPEEMLEKVLKDETVPADIKSENGKANWKALREQAKAKKEYEAKWKAVQAELDQIKNAPKTAVDPTEFENIKKERDILSERLKDTDVERHPAFQAYFSEKTSNILAEAKKVGGVQFGDKLAGLLKQPESEQRNAQLEEIYSQLTPFNQSRLTKVVTDADALQVERSTELEKAKNNYDKIQKMQRDQAQQVQQQQISQLNDAINRHLAEAEKNLPVYQRRDGDDKWNSQVDQLKASVKSAFTGTPTMDDLAQAAIWARAAPIILQDSIAKAQQLDALQKELNSLRAAKPKPGAGESPNQSPAMPESMSPIDRILHQAKQAGAIR